MLQENLLEYKNISKTFFFLILTAKITMCFVTILFHNVKKVIAKTIVKKFLNKSKKYKLTEIYCINNLQIRMKMKKLVS